MGIPVDADVRLWTTLGVQREIHAQLTVDLTPRVTSFSPRNVCCFTNR
jgi:hypothetical protein